MAAITKIGSSIYRHCFAASFTENFNYVQTLRAFSAGKDYEFIKVEKRGEKSSVGLITLNRRNALCLGLMWEVSKALGVLERDKTVGAIVITGSEKSFAGCADVNEMMDKTHADYFSYYFLTTWDRIVRTTKPIIAAVNGYALGGGCELAMLCDIIYAGENAKFGQPEIANGTIPGAGCTQRLIHSIGKSKAMEIVLTGGQFGASDAERWGLVSKVFPADQVVDEAVKLGEKICSHSKLIVAVCKKSVTHAYEKALTEGLKDEERIFRPIFATNDRKEGMTAFAEKRKPNFTDT